MKTIAFPAALCAIMATTAQSAGNEITELKAQIAALEEKTDILMEETASMKSGVEFGTIDESQTLHGMGDGASKVYYSKSPLSIGGYGEMYWASEDRDGKDAYADVYRFVPYIGYKFSDSIILNTEIEIEHGGAKVVTEFMYLDFLIDKVFNVRVGHLLVPIGLTNLRHEPTLFNTVQRPDVEKYLIPSTWHENGLLAYGEIETADLSYSVGFVNALDFNNADAGTYKWIRSGRAGAGEKATMQRAAFVGRLDYRGVNGLLVGASGYYGDGAQGRPAGTSAVMGDIHAVYENGPFKAKALYTMTKVRNADKIAATAAKEAYGYYVNAQYDLLSTASTNHKLPLFMQYEQYDPTSEVVSGTVDNELSSTVVGFNYLPQDQVVLKLDYTKKDYSDAAKEDYNTLSVGIGFVF